MVEWTDVDLAYSPGPGATFRASDKTFTVAEIGRADVPATTEAQSHFQQQLADLARALNTNRLPVFVNWRGTPLRMDQGRVGHAIANGVLAPPTNNTKAGYVTHVELLDQEHLRPLTRKAVDSAIAEFDRIGRTAFLETYGFAGAKDYFLVVGEKNYDSKAIAAVAHKYLPGGRALAHHELSGGAADAGKKLAALGYRIEKPGQNADWTWDEHVLALDLYVTQRGKPLQKGAPQIAELSQLLQQLGVRTDAKRTPKFRNEAGVYMKLMNFRRLDPQYQAEGKRGLQQGARGEEAVWNRYIDDLTRLRSEAAAIRAAIMDQTIPLTSLEDEEHEAEEGRIVLRLHKLRERDGRLPEKKRAAVLKETGRLACEVCEFDFAERFGSRGHGFIEVHHRQPVATLLKGAKTKLADLAVVCANCHRMLHRKGLISVEDLRAMVSSALPSM